MDNTILDLDKHTLIPMPKELGAYDQKLALSPTTSLPQFAVYTDESHALAEVTYTRVAERLGLSCARAYFAVVRGPNDRSERWVSASAYAPDWVPFVLWRADPQVYPQGDCLSDLRCFRVLDLLLQKCVYIPHGWGYLVPPDMHFVKANNGGALFSMGFHLFVATGDTEISSHQYRAYPSEILGLVDDDPAAKEILHKVANLTDANLRACVEYPENRIFDQGRVYYLRRLEVAREVAEQCIKRTSDGSHG